MKRMLALLLVLTITLLLAGCGGNDCTTCPKTGAIIYINTHKIDLGADQTTAVFTILNKGENALSWDITSSSAPWLTVSPTSGNGDANINVTVDRQMLTHIGVYHATLTISSNSINSETEVVDVFVLDPGEWLMTDMGQRDSCRAVDQYDFAWIKGFALPSGVSNAFVDSLSINVCDADTVQLVVFSAIWNSDSQLWLPNSIIYLSDNLYVVPEGWITIPTDIYASDPLIFLGYLQFNTAGPEPGIGDAVEEDTIGSGHVFTDPSDPTGLYWETLDSPTTTLLIRAFISPVIGYSPKLVPGSSLYYEDLFTQRLAERGVHPVSLLPRLR